MKTSYTFNREENNGYEDCAILIQHFNDTGSRFHLMSKEEFAKLQPWEFCRFMNDAYATGKRDALEEVRNILGVKDR